MYFRPPDAESKSASNESIFKPNGLYLSVLRWEYYAALSTCLFGRKKKKKTVRALCSAHGWNMAGEPGSYQRDDDDGWLRWWEQEQRKRSKFFDVENSTWPRDVGVPINFKINLHQTCIKHRVNASRNLLEVYSIVLLISLTLYGIGLHSANEHCHHVMLQRLWADVAILKWFEPLRESFCLSSIHSLFTLLSTWTCFSSFLVSSPTPLSDLPYFLKLRRIQITSYSRFRAWWPGESAMWVWFPFQ